MSFYLSLLIYKSYHILTVDLRFQQLFFEIEVAQLKIMPNAS